MDINLWINSSFETFDHQISSLRSEKAASASSGRWRAPRAQGARGWQGRRAKEAPSIPCSHHFSPFFIIKSMNYLMNCLRIAGIPYFLLAQTIILRWILSQVPFTKRGPNGSCGADIKLSDATSWTEWFDGGLWYNTLYICVILYNYTCYCMIMHDLLMSINYLHMRIMVVDRCFRHKSWTMIVIDP